MYNWNRFARDETTICGQSHPWTDPQRDAMQNSNRPRAVRRAGNYMYHHSASNNGVTLTRT